MGQDVRPIRWQLVVAKNGMIGRHVAYAYVKRHEGEERQETFAHLEKKFAQVVYFPYAYQEQPNGPPKFEPQKGPGDLEYMGFINCG